MTRVIFTRRDKLRIYSIYFSSIYDSIVRFYNNWKKNVFFLYVVASLIFMTRM